VVAGNGGKVSDSGTFTSAEARIKTMSPRLISRGLFKVKAKSSASRREHLRQVSDAEQFQYARCHVGEFKPAPLLLDCGHLKSNQRSKARAIQMFYITKVDSDSTARENERTHQSFYFARGVADEIPMALYCRNFIAFCIIIF
jgi:hypothetical protein